MEARQQGTVQARDSKIPGHQSRARGRARRVAGVHRRHQGRLSTRTTATDLLDGRAHQGGISLPGCAKREQPVPRTKGNHDYENISASGSFPVARIAVLTDGNATLSRPLRWAASRWQAQLNATRATAMIVTPALTSRPRGAAEASAGRLERRANGAREAGADYVRAGPRQRRQRDQAADIPRDRDHRVPYRKARRSGSGSGNPCAEVTSKKRGEA